MVKSAVFFCSLIAALPVCLGDEPSGEFVELHSCDLYTGGCTASAEATLLGRELFRLWSIRQGRFNQEDLAGIKAAVLEFGLTNLAESGALPDRAEIFVPTGLTAARKSALLSWIATQQTLPASTAVIEASISYWRIGSWANAVVGDSVAFSTMRIGKCRTGACGQAVWYEPQSKHSAFEVLASRVSQITDRAARFYWLDHDRPNVFLASFGSNGDRIQLADAVCN